MVPSIRNGLRPVTAPATRYWSSSMIQVRMNTNTTTPRKVAMTVSTWPPWVMLRKMPKM